MQQDKPLSWTFLTNHSHVLICLHRNSNMRLRDVAEHVGITERGVQRILQELEQAGVITRKKVGRCNTYDIHPDQPLRHPIESHCHVNDLLQMIDTDPNAS